MLQCALVRTAKTKYEGRLKRKYLHCWKVIHTKYEQSPRKQVTFSASKLSTRNTSTVSQNIKASDAFKRLIQQRCKIGYWNAWKDWLRV